MYRILLFLIFSVKAIGAETATNDDLAELKRRITQIVERQDVPAVGIAMVNAQGPIWVTALGQANLADDIAANADTRFRIASTSKIFVGLAALKLMEAGRLSLDQELAQLAPEVEFQNPWEATNPVRLVHLLEHTSGWDEQHYPEFAQSGSTSLRADIEFHPHSRHSRWPPGSRFSYTNSGTAVAAYVIERVTGRQFESYVRDELLRPIGMDTATYFEPAPESRVTLYDQNRRPLPYRHLFMRPAGALNASPRDMAALVGFFLRRGSGRSGAVLSADSVTRMEIPQSSVAAQAGQTAGYGLANYTSAHQAWVYHGHDGGFDGAMSEFAYLPEANVGHAIMMSSKNQRAFRNISALIREFETRSLAPGAKLSGTNDAAVVSGLEGLYYPTNPRVQLLEFLFRFGRITRFDVDGSILTRRGLLGGKRRVFRHAGNGLFLDEQSGMAALSIVQDPLLGTVIHDASGNAASSSHAVYKRMPTFVGYVIAILEVAWPVTVASTIFYFPIWLVRRLRGRIAAGASTTIRVWPLLASVAMVLVVGLLRLASSDFHGYLGNPSWIAIGICLATLAFALFSVLAVAAVIAARGRTLNRLNYWYCAATSAVHLLMLIYFVDTGVIGIRFWS